MMHIEMDVDLDHTLGCGQAHRWSKKDGVWEGVLNNSIIRLERSEDGFTFTGSDAGTLKKYFRDDDDLDLIYRDISRDPVIADLVERYHGLRILRQEHWECTATYLLATNANVKRIGSMVESVCRVFGRDLGGRFSFPRPKEILDRQERVCECRLGYRDKRLIELAANVESGEIDLNAISDLDYEGCVNALKGINGVGDKVADCIALFSYDHLQAVPIDARIKKRLDEIYGLRGSYAKVSSSARDMFGSYAGYAQEFLYHCGI